MERMIEVSAALELILKNTLPLVKINCSLSEASFKVLAEDIQAPSDVPAFDQSAMDGYAFQFNDIAKALEITDTIPAGSSAETPVVSGTAQRIFTGSKVPDGADTVVMQEHVTITEGGITIESPNLKRGSNIRKAGSQIKKGDLALKTGTVLNAAGIGFIASMGIDTVQVYKQPSVKIIVTGSELVAPGTPLSPGGTYESNSVMLETSLRSIGWNTISSAHVSDEKEDTLALIREASKQADVVIVTGGVSVGDFDFVHQMQQVEGFDAIFHKVKQKPGKPFLFGMHKGVPVFGLPGNPASVLTCFYIYVLPYLIRSAGRLNYQVPSVHRPLLSAVNKREHLTVFLKGKVHLEGVEVLPQQESYILRSYAEADCLIILPSGKASWNIGEMAEAVLIPKFG
jgi:molybdopterin molybdotransferase